MDKGKVTKKGLLKKLFGKRERSKPDKEVVLANPQCPEEGVILDFSVFDKVEKPNESDKRGCGKSKPKPEPKLKRRKPKHKKQTGKNGYYLL